MKKPLHTNSTAKKGFFCIALFDMSRTKKMLLFFFFFSCRNQKTYFFPLSLWYYSFWWMGWIWFLNWRWWNVYTGESAEKVHKIVVKLVREIFVSTGKTKSYWNISPLPFNRASNSLNNTLRRWDKIRRQYGQGSEDHDLEGLGLKLENCPWLIHRGRGQNSEKWYFHLYIRISKDHVILSYQSSLTTLHFETCPLWLLNKKPKWYLLLIISWKVIIP